VEVLNALNVIEGVLVTEVTEGDWARMKPEVGSVPVSRVRFKGFFSCVNEGGNPRAGMDWPAAVRACTTEAHPCSSTLIRSLSS
jgi:hypothetical protein